MRTQARPDFLMALFTLALVTIGCLLILSASSILAFGRYQDQLHFLKRQAAFGLAGILLLAWVQGLSAETLRRWIYPALWVSILLLALVLVPGLGRKVGGARRWLLFFQPSEVFKLVAVLYAADRLAWAAEAGGDWKDGLWQLWPLGLGLGLVLLEPDFGSTVLTALMLVGMLFAAGIPVRHLLAVALLGLAGMAAAIIQKPYRLRRVAVFLDPWKDPGGAGFQITHSLMAFGTGGIFGAGLGKGVQKLYYLPEPHTDFIFATAGEELGLLGCLTIVGLFVLLLWRCWLVTLKARPGFLKMASLGLTLFLGLQVLANLFVVLGMAPTKGTTLPFLSSGGSALVIDLAAMGLLLSFSKQLDAEEKR